MVELKYKKKLVFSKQNNANAYRLENKKTNSIYLARIIYMITDTNKKIYIHLSRTYAYSLKYEQLNIYLNQVK